MLPLFCDYIRSSLLHALAVSVEEIIGAAIGLPDLKKTFGKHLDIGVDSRSNRFTCQAVKNSVAAAHRIAGIIRQGAHHQPLLIERERIAQIGNILKKEGMGGISLQVGLPHTAIPNKHQSMLKNRDVVILGRIGYASCSIEESVASSVHHNPKTIRLRSPYLVIGRIYHPMPCSIDQTQIAIRRRHSTQSAMKGIAEIAHAARIRTLK